MVLCQDCLGRPVLRLQSLLQEVPTCKPLEPGNDPARDQRGWDDQEGKTATNGVGQDWLFSIRKRISSLVTKSDQCTSRMDLRHHTSNAPIFLDKDTARHDHYLSCRQWWKVGNKTKMLRPRPRPIKHKLSKTTCGNRKNSSVATRMFVIKNNFVQQRQKVIMTSEAYVWHCFCTYCTKK